MTKSKKDKNKPKLNLTVRDEQRNKLEQMASLENRSLSNLIEVMADERWKRLAEQQGVAYAKTVAEAMKLKLDMDNPADREKLRRAVLDLVAGRKMPKVKTAWLKFSGPLSDKHFAVPFTLLPRARGRHVSLGRHETLSVVAMCICNPDRSPIESLPGKTHPPLDR